MATATMTEKFPSLSPTLPEQQEPTFRANSPHSASPHLLAAAERWTAKRDNAPPAAANPGSRRKTGRSRQKSLSEAFSTIRARNGSVSQNAHEIADALRAPLSWKLIALCIAWYMMSTLSNTSSKTILTAFPKPITLTTIQFAFVSSWCLFLSYLARIYPRLKTSIPILKFGIRPPTKDLIMTTLPLTLFQIGGHILSSDAIARIPVSLVHTIKGLSPLFTVLAYRFIFNINYSWPTYLSLVPLTFGVVLACSGSFRGNFLGLVYALASALLFVTQNIVSKKLFNEAAQAEADGVSMKNRKPDKFNLLCYSSGLSFLLTSPIWLWSEGFGLIGDFLVDASLDLTEKPGSVDHGRLAMEFFFNGTTHFLQSLVAFVLLSMVSPVTYSVASLFKRVFVILFAIIWFGQAMTKTQGFGFLLTFLGLYLYDRTHDAEKADKKARKLHGSTNRPNLLPLSKERPPLQSNLSTIIDSPISMSPVTTRDQQKDYIGQVHSSSTGASPRGDAGNGWLPPGTKQEQTWMPQDMGSNSVPPVR